MCLMVVKLAAPSSVRTRHSSSRKTRSMIQCMLSTAQWLRTTGPNCAARSSRGQEQQGCDVEARLELGFSPAFARAFAHDDCFQDRPVMSFMGPGVIIVILRESLRTTYTDCVLLNPCQRLSSY